MCNAHIHQATGKGPKHGPRPGLPVPPPAPDEPSDEELLRYLDGALTPEERRSVQARLGPLARARIELLAEALEENGWPVD